MALILGELPIIEAISDAFTFFKANLVTQIPDIFAYASTADQTQITNLWSNPKYNPIIIGGYPDSSLNAPTIAVTIENEGEPEQFASSSATGIYLNGSPAHAGEFETVFHCHCFSAGYKNLLWLQVLTKWALLAQRSMLMQGVTPDGYPTGYFNKQTISLTGLMRAPDNLGDGIPVFQRTVILKATHIDTWTELQQNAIYEGGSIVVNEQMQPGRITVEIGG